MDNEEQRYDNEGWQDPGQQEIVDPAANTTPVQNNDSYGLSQDTNYYNNTQSDGGFTQSNDGFTQTNDGYNSVNDQGYNNYVPEPEEGPGFAIAGMVCGILSIVCCCQPYIAGVLSIVGLVLSIIALRGQKPGRGMAIAGVVCSVIGLLIVIFMIIAQIFLLLNPGYRQSFMDMYRSMES